MRRFIILALFMSVFVMNAQEVVTVGQVNAQIHNEFSNLWASRPIYVEQNNKGQTILKVGNMNIGSGGGQYRARCVLTADERNRLVDYLSRGLEMTQESGNRPSRDQTKKIGEFIRGEGWNRHGLKVDFFDYNRELNPTGVILFIRDFEDNFHVRLYLYPEQIRHLLNLLGMASNSLKRL